MTLPQYATVADVARAATGGWDELAQRASASSLVDGVLLQARADGADTSAWPPEAVTQAGVALARVQDVINRASRHADTLLFMRYRKQMPLGADVVQASSLPDAVAAIALRRLYGASVPEELRKGTQWADDYLKSLMRGDASLGVEDAVVPTSPTTVRVRAPRPTFDLDKY